MERLTRIPLHYFSYNTPDISAFVTVSVLFFSFYVILVLMFQYEYYNAINYCDPKFYYGRACRNEIADRILSDPGLVSAKQNFYNTMQKVDAARSTDKSEIENANADVQMTLDTNAEFRQETVDQINEVTDVVNAATANYLGNLQGLVQSTQNTASSTWTQLQSIPPLLKDLQSQIQQSIVTPALAPYTGPLQKLYQSLSQLPTVQA